MDGLARVRMSYGSCSVRSQLFDVLDLDSPRRLGQCASGDQVAGYTLTDLIVESREGLSQFVYESQQLQVGGYDAAGGRFAA